MNYTIDKYHDRILCDSSEFDTFIECMSFADDGFCDQAIIKDRGHNMQYTIKMEPINKKEEI